MLAVLDNKTRNRGMKYESMFGLLETLLPTVATYLISTS